MNSENYTIEEIKEKAIPIAKKYGVKKLALFGSYALGENKTDSDIDFILDKGKIQGLDFFGFSGDLENEFGKKIDMLTYDSMPKSKYFGPINEVIIYES